MEASYSFADSEGDGEGEGERAKKIIRVGTEIDAFAGEWRF